MIRNVSLRLLKCAPVNLPVGAAVLVVVFFFLPKSVGESSDEVKALGWWQFLRRFNPVGTAILLPSIICLILALEWGGIQYAWSDSRVIAVLVVFGVTMITWLVMQWYQGDDATVPWSVASQRSVAGATLYTLFGSASFTIVVYYLPIW